MVKSCLKQVTARISSTSANQFGLLRIRVLAVALSAINASPSGSHHLGFLHCAELSGRALSSALAKSSPPESANPPATPQLHPRISKAVAALP